MEEKPGYLVVVQCRRVVGQTCSGYKCEHAFASRSGGFTRYPAGGAVRYLSLPCGGCPGRSLGARLAELKRGLAARKETCDTRIAVHLATCMTHVGPSGAMCPHLEAIAGQIERAGLPWHSTTHGKARAF